MYQKIVFAIQGEPMPTSQLTVNRNKKRTVTPREKRGSIGKKELEQIIRLNQGGYYVSEIAEFTSRTTEQIETALWNEGVKPRTHKYEADQVQMWIQMYTGEFDGSPWSFAEIARKTKFAYSTIQLAVLRAGIRDRHPDESRRLAWQRKLMLKQEN
jgi:hypothetical protein